MVVAEEWGLGKVAGVESLSISHPGKLDTIVIWEIFRKKKKLV